MATCAAGSMLFFIAWPLWLRTLTATLILLVALRQRSDLLSRRLKLVHETDGSWSVYQLQQDPYSTEDTVIKGSLVEAGYRNTRLVILAIQCQQGRLHRIPVWADQLSGPEFSYLHMQLTFNSEPRQGLGIRLCLERMRHGSRE